MVDSKNISILPTLKSAFGNFTSIVKKMPCNFANKNQAKQGTDEFKHSGSDPIPPEVRLKSTANKMNAENLGPIRVAETNYFANLDNDYQLLQEYIAYKDPELNNLKFITATNDTVEFTSEKGKSVKIKHTILEDKSKQYEINFDDGSQITYILFSEGVKMNIYGEEFEMPDGSFTKIQSVGNRKFCQLIQVPGTSVVINKPEIIGKVDEILNNPISS